MIINFQQTHVCYCLFCVKDKDTCSLSLLCFRKSGWFWIDDWGIQIYICICICVSVSFVTIKPKTWCRRCGLFMQWLLVGVFELNFMFGVHNSCKLLQTLNCFKFYGISYRCFVLNLKWQKFSTFRNKHLKLHVVSCIAFLYFFRLIDSANCNFFWHVNW